MTAAVPSSMQNWSADAGKIRVVASSSMLALPLVDAANHLLGHKQMGLIHCQPSTSALEGVGRVYSYAHPNCEYLVAEFGVEDVAEAAGAEVVLQAGTGAAVTVDVPGDGRYGPIAFAWGAGDTEEEITYTPTDCKIRWCTIWGLYRRSLDVSGGDLGVETQDSASLGAGMRENNCIINGDGMADLEAQDQANRDALLYTIRQAVSWSNLGATTCNVVPGGASAHPMPANFIWNHRARRLYGTAGEKREYVCWVRSYFDGNPATDSFEWTLTAGSGDTVSSGALVATAAAWAKGPTTLLLDATADDSIDLTFTSTDAAASCTVIDVSIYEYIAGAPGPAPAALYAYYGDSSGDGVSADRFEWPVDDLGAADLDWADGDGTTPDQGPSPLVAAGTITAGCYTPWRSTAHADITCSEFKVGANYTIASAAADPANDQDFVLLALIRFWADSGGGASDVFMIGSGNYIRLRISSAGALSVTVKNSAATTTSITGSVRLGAWNLVGVTYDASGNMELYIQGVSTDTDASPGGDISDGNGIGINSNPFGSNDGGCDIARIVYWHQDDCAAIATDSWHAKVAEAVLGIRPEVGTTGSTYERTTEGIYYLGHTYGAGEEAVHIDNCPHIVDVGMAPAGGAAGLGSDEQIVTKVSKNYDFVAGDAAALTTCYASGANPCNADEIDDSANLRGARELGPYVIRVIAGVIA